MALALPVLEEEDAVRRRPQQLPCPCRAGGRAHPESFVRIPEREDAGGSAYGRLLRPQTSWLGLWGRKPGAGSGWMPVLSVTESWASLRLCPSPASQHHSSGRRWPRHLLPRAQPGGDGRPRLGHTFLDGSWGA